MMLKKFFATSVLFLSFSALADSNPPPPPTLNDVSSLQACTAYATSMQNWLLGLSNPSFEDSLNSGWFESFSENADSSDSYSQACNNGVCTNYYDQNGGMTGCYVVNAVNSPAIKQALLNSSLLPAYQLAIKHQFISQHPNGFGLYGAGNGPKICTATDGYQYCQLSIS